MLTAPKRTSTEDAIGAPHNLDPIAQTQFADIADRSLHATIARFTGGLSPAAVAGAYLDWAVHLAAAPGKQIQLAQKATRKAIRLGNYAFRYASDGEGAQLGIEPLPQDRRFIGDGWKKWPFNVISQAFLMQQQWWHNATTDVRGVSRKHENMVQFGARQILDVAAPSNFPLTNPEIFWRTIGSGGFNLMNGFRNLVEDWERAVGGKGPVGTENFIVGRDVAISPGKIVYRNGLIELIQYEPTTPTVRPEPVLIVTAWIMKYYILDLSPHNSLVKYLTERGFTVFMISWKNPGPEDRDLAFEDYRSLGVMSALDAVNAIVPDRKAHAVGYCLGGTLLSIAAAAMARDGDERLKTVSLFAAQTDFTEAGELMLFIDESQITFLEDMMWEQGFLDNRQMAGAFQMLRSNDLVWSRVVHDYLLGEREPLTDLMAWNADATRLPYRMHSQYLRKLFLDNELAEGHFVAADGPVALTDIHVPVFAVGTERDHVAPWQSTYKINLQVGGAVTYVLATGGHNVGIVSEPGQAGRSFRMLTKAANDRYIDPERFLVAAKRYDGSWWPAWAEWIGEHSSAETILQPMGAPQTGYPVLGDAPGTYVFGR
jgi:polyhydroxyalkanoate synthase